SARAAYSRSVRQAAAESAGSGTTMHRSGGKAPSAGAVSALASPVRLPATAGRLGSRAGAYGPLPISTAYERPAAGRRTAATTSTGATGPPTGPGVLFTLALYPGSPRHDILDG